MGERQRREGLIGFPEHYHNAVMYSEKYRFFAPEREGILGALRRDLAGLSLAGASWAVERGLVTDARTGAQFPWAGEEMVRPLVPRVATWLAGAEYCEAAARTEEKARFAVDSAAVERVLDEVRGMR